MLLSSHAVLEDCPIFSSLIFELFFHPVSTNTLVSHYLWHSMPILFPLKKDPQNQSTVSCLDPFAPVLMGFCGNPWTASSPTQNPYNCLIVSFLTQFQLVNLHSLTYLLGQMSWSSNALLNKCLWISEAYLASCINCYIPVLFHRISCDVINVRVVL